MESQLTFYFSDNMPEVCVACSAEATGQTSFRVELPKDETAKQMSLVQMIGLLFGFFIFWHRTEPGPLDNQWMALPTCGRHNKASELSQFIELNAVDRRRARLSGASLEFRRAFQSANAPPSAEMLAAMDSQNPENAVNFLEKVDVESPAEFLDGLEQED